jgi:hypothetical protein
MQVLFDSVIKNIESLSKTDETVGYYKLRIYTLVKYSLSKYQNIYFHGNIYGAILFFNNLTSDKNCAFLIDSFKCVYSRNIDLQNNFIQKFTMLFIEEIQTFHICKANIEIYATSDQTQIKDKIISIDHIHINEKIIEQKEKCVIM